MKIDSSQGNLSSPGKTAVITDEDWTKEPPEIFSHYETIIGDKRVIRVPVYVPNPNHKKTHD